MKIELKINTNDKFQVVLTEHGYEILLKDVEKTFLNHLTHKYLYLTQHEIQNPDNRRTYQFQLHELMNIFGSEMYVGNPNQCFVDNVITKIIERD